MSTRSKEMRTLVGASVVGSKPVREALGPPMRIAEMESALQKCSLRMTKLFKDVERLGATDVGEADEIVSDAYAVVKAAYKDSEFNQDAADAPTYAAANYEKLRGLEKAMVAAADSVEQAVQAYNAAVDGLYTARVKARETFRETADFLGRQK